MKHYIITTRLKDGRTRNDLVIAESFKEACALLDKEYTQDGERTQHGVYVMDGKFILKRIE